MPVWQKEVYGEAQNRGAAMAFVNRFRRKNYLTY